MQLLGPGSDFAVDFRVVRPLNEGGMGAVYVVEQRSTGMLRALKVMQPQLVKDARLRQRFEQEAKVGGRIKSDHVVQVVGAGIDAPTGMPWLAMELLEGEDLAAHVARRGVLSFGEVTALFTQLCHALSAAHSEGIVHRDLKPENIFLAVSRTAGMPFMLKVLDFGIAKVVAEAHATGATTGPMGTPLWMAPEQAESGHGIRPATDVWALGLIAFRMLVGRIYWREANRPEPTVMALLKETLFAPIDAASVRANEYGGRLPPWFDEWFRRCVTRDADSRYKDAAVAFAAWLELAGGASNRIPVAIEVSAQSLPAQGGVAKTIDATVSPRTTQGAPRHPPTELMPATPLALAETATRRPRRSNVTAVAAGALMIVLASSLALLVTRRAKDTGTRGGAAVSGNTSAGYTEASMNPAAEALAASTVPHISLSTSAATAVASASLAATASAAMTVASASPSTTVPAVTQPPKPSKSAAASPINGRLEPEVIKKVIRSHFPRFRACYELELKKNPNAKGTVAVRFVIGMSGAVEWATLQPGSPLSNEVTSCCVSVYRSMVFPQPEGGTVMVTYPIDFQNDD